MKKLIITFANLLIITSLFAQAPNAFKYQTVVRNSSNQIITNQAVGLKISILQGSATGTAVYVETHAKTTNALGIVNLEIGNGTPVSGSISGINWATNSYYVKIELDPAGGTTYQLMGTSQLLSVPYALYATNSVWEKNLAGIHYKGGFAGIGTNNPEKILHLYNDDTPTLRLQQSGVAWPAYSWDIAANESNFFIRDNTSSATLPFRILPGSAMNTLVLSGGNVGVGTASPSQKLHVAGTAKVDGTVIPGNYTNSALPIAYGNVNSAGTLSAGTSNISAVTWNASLSRYEITITGESYNTGTYVTIVTPRANSYISYTSSVSGNLLVYFINTSGTPVQASFQFVTYKP